MLKICLDANVTPPCHFQHPVPKEQTGVKGEGRADIFVILLLTRVNGKGAYWSLSGLASRAEQLIPPKGLGNAVKLINFTLY